MVKKFRIAIVADIIAESYTEAKQIICDSLKSKLPSEQTGFIGLTIYPENSIKAGP